MSNTKKTLGSGTKNLQKSCGSLPNEMKAEDKSKSIPLNEIENKKVLQKTKLYNKKK